MPLFTALITIFFLTILGLLTFLILNPLYGKHKAGLGCLLVPLSTVGILLLINWWFTPVQPTRADMNGRWEIHRKMYPGANADWQRKNFWIEIRGGKLTIHDKTFAKPVTASATINWFVSPEYRFRVINAPEHHLFALADPDIYRGYKGYYLVFKSSRYGNMFFERVSS